MVFRPQRKPAGADQDFEDPLSDYSPPVYGDDLERSLCEDQMTAMHTTPFETIGPDTTIEQAIKLMVDKDVACLTVTQGDHLLGVFTERDVLNKAITRFEEIKNYPVRILMTHEPGVVYNTDCPATALNLMAIGGFRHVPILDLENRVVGIVGPRRVVAYLKKFLFPG